MRAPRRASSAIVAILRGTGGCRGAGAAGRERRAARAGVASRPTGSPRRPPSAPAAPAARRRRVAGAPLQASRRSSPATARCSCAPTASRASPSKYVEAEGKVELRTRDADGAAPTGCATTSCPTRSGARATSCCAGASTGSPGPEFAVQARHRDRVLSRRRTSIIGENGARGSAAELRFAGPDRYEVTDARYTTCVAPREDWYIAHRARSRSTRRARSAPAATRRCTSSTCPIGYTPWLEFPLSERAQDRVPDADRWARRAAAASKLAAPYYLNLAPNYDATITPRLMTKRGLQLGGQFRYLVRAQSAGRAQRRVPPRRPRDRHQPLGARSWKHNQDLRRDCPGCRATSTSTRCPTTPISPTSPTASR